MDDKVSKSGDRRLMNFNGTLKCTRLYRMAEFSQNACITHSVFSTCNPLIGYGPLPIVFLVAYCSCVYFPTFS